MRVDWDSLDQRPIPPLVELGIEYYHAPDDRLPDEEPPLGFVEHAYGWSYDPPPHTSRVPVSGTRRIYLRREAPAGTLACLCRYWTCAPWSCWPIGEQQNSKRKREKPPLER